MSPGGGRADWSARGGSGAAPPRQNWYKGYHPSSHDENPGLPKRKNPATCSLERTVPEPGPLERMEVRSSDLLEKPVENSLSCPNQPL